MPAVGRLQYLEQVPAGRVKGTVLLIHAFPLNARMWQPQLALAADGWRVLAPQLRGFDRAEGESPVSSIDDYVADIVDLLDALHVPEAIVVGLSMGGYVALALIRLAARYVHGLILADTRAEADTPEGKAGRARTLDLLHERGVDAVVDDLIPKLLADATVRERHDIVETVRTLGLANRPDAIEAAIKAMMTRPDSTPLLRTITAPTLVLVGEHDRVTPPSAGDAMARGIPRAEFIVIPDAAHLSNLEQPARFNAAVSRFLEHRV